MGRIAYTGFPPDQGFASSMHSHRQYDTVAFDVRDNAAMLFFARTSASGDIDDYLLLMRADGADSADALYIEVNERQFAGHGLVREARLTPDVLTLDLCAPAAELDGATRLVLAFEGSPENRANVQAGAFRILGDCLAGGHA